MEINSRRQCLEMDSFLVLHSDLHVQVSHIDGNQ